MRRESCLLGRWRVYRDRSSIKGIDVMPSRAQIIPGQVNCPYFEAGLVDVMP